MHLKRTLFLKCLCFLIGPIYKIIKIKIVNKTFALPKY